MNTSLLCSSITKVSGLLSRGATSASELCELCLARIRETAPLNAFVTITGDSAREEARQADRRIAAGKPLGPLEGIPLAVKDNWSTQGVRTTCASRMLSPYEAPYDATAVRRLRALGAVIVGKTNLDEFAMGSATVDSHFGPCRNPWRSGLRYALRRRGVPGPLQPEEVDVTAPDGGDFYVSGGSSGGSAVAVATGSCFGALASDTGGSTRSPAALCGTVGLKPSYGRVSRQGLVPLAHSLDAPGLLARTADDAALLLDCVSGVDPLDSTTVPCGPPVSPLPEDFDVTDLTVGIPQEYEECPGLSPATSAAWREVSDLLASRGARVRRVSLPHTRHSIVCYSVLCCCDVASNFARYDGLCYGHRSADGPSSDGPHPFASTRREGFGEVVRERILAGNYFLLKRNYERYFLRAARVRRLICEDFRAVFDGEGVDVLLTPVTPGEAQRHSRWTPADARWSDYCTQPANMAGLPAVSIPCRLSPDGLPVSLQLIGRPFQERHMLSVAKWIEQRVDFPLLDFGAAVDPPAMRTAC